MRAILPLTVLLLATGASAQQAAPVVPTGGLKVCADRIHQVREERGLPRLDRGTAAPDEPLLIAAVDRRIDGCSVMVMRYDTRDVRPLPTEERPPQLERIPGR